jgi:uncharacterized membrane protein
MLRASVDRAVVVVVAEIPGFSGKDRMAATPARREPGGHVSGDDLSEALMVPPVAPSVGGGARGVFGLLKLGAMLVAAAPVGQVRAAGYWTDGGAARALH